MKNQAPSARFALFVLCGINLMNFFDRSMIGAVAEPIRKEWALSDTALGTLGTAFIILYAFAGIPLGRLSDRWSRVKILSAGVALWSLFTALSGFATSYAVMFAARLGVGVGEASCAPAGNALIGDLFPAERRARAISVFMLGLPLGISLSYWLCGWIAQNYGWRRTFLVATLPGLGLAGLALLIREPQRPTKSDQAGVASPYRRILRLRTMWWLIVSGALHNFIAYAVSLFLPALLGRFHELNLRSANNITAVVLGLGGMVGLLGGGPLSDWLGRFRPSGRLLLSSVSVSLAAPCVFFALEMPRGAVAGFMLLMGASWMLMYVYYVTVYAAIQDLVHPSLRGTAMAIYFFAMYLLGGSLGPILTGRLSDSFAARAMVRAGAALTQAGTIPEQFKAIGLHDAMYTLPALSLLLGAVLFAASRTVTRDLKRVEITDH